MSVRPTTDATHDVAKTTTATRAVTRACLATDGIVADASLVAAGPSMITGAATGGSGMSRGR